VAEGDVLQPEKDAGAARGQLSPQLREMGLKGESRLAGNLGDLSQDRNGWTQKGSSRSLML
jgi:hypothetical protein